MRSGAGAGHWIAVGLALAACTRTPQGARTEGGGAWGAAAEQVGTPPASPPAAPGTLVEGMRGLRIESRLTYLQFADRPHLLTATYLFPDRARLDVQLVHPQLTLRNSEYRCGARFYSRAAGGAPSEELTAQARDDVWRRFELRRALFLWPAGFPWSEAEEPSATLAAASEQSGEQRPLGTLRAELDSDGRPQRMAVLRPDGSEQEALRAESWAQRRGRTWPARLTWEMQGEAIGDETVTEVAPDVRFAELYFLPPDRAAAEAPAVELRGQLAGEGRTPWQRTQVRRFPLAEAERTWAAALRNAEDRRVALADQLAGAGLQLSPRPGFEVDGAGRPAALWLFLDPVPPELAPGFEPLGPGTARVAFAPSFAAIDAAVLRPLGSGSGTPTFARETVDGERVMVVRLEGSGGG
jgi:hypothetical protein